MKSLSKKQIILLSFFAVIFSIILKYFLFFKNKNELPEGCENFDLLSGEITNETIALKLGEYHDSRDIALKCAFNLISYWLYGVTANNAFLNTTHPFNVYFEGACVRSDAENKAALCYNKTSERMFPLYRISQNASTWSNRELHIVYGSLLEVSRSIMTLEQVILFQRANDADDELMYALLSDTNHPGYQVLFNGIMNEAFIKDNMNMRHSIMLVRETLRSIVESGVRMLGKLPLSLLIEIMIRMMVQREVNVTLAPGENATTINHHIFSSDRAKNISVGRNDHFFELANNVTRYPSLSFFLAGNFHAFEMQKRFSEKPNSRVAIVAMKELSDAHREKRKQQEAYKKSLR